ncbi:MAG: metallophosphoesterase family protein [bacterium]
MKILSISDIHGNTQIIEFLSPRIKEADLILLSGDITHFGKETQVKMVIDTIERYNQNILAIPGNCDYPEVNEFLDKKGMNLHGKIKIIQGISFVGFGGSLPCPTKTPYEFSEEELKTGWKNALKNYDPKTTLVFISHQPPFETINDKLPTGEHVGSIAVKNIIEEYQPLACFSGHIHEGKGMDHIGDTSIINPGPLSSGKYAYAEIENNLLKDIQIKCIV